MQRFAVNGHSAEDLSAVLQQNGIAAGRVDAFKTDLLWPAKAQA